MVPEGWRADIIGNHISIVSGYPFKSHEYTDNSDGIRLLRGDNIAQGYIRWSGCKRWINKDKINVERFALKPADLVIAMDRTWVSSGLKISEIRHEDCPSLLVQRVSRLRSKDSFVQELLKQIFNSFRFEQYVKSVQTETAVPHISAQQIKEFPILLPPLTEQKKIARILSTWDKAIETVDKLIENSKQQKKALMQQLLTGKKRLPGFSGEWKEVRLGDLFQVTIGVTPSRKNNAYWDQLKASGNKWVAISDLKNKFLVETNEYITDAGAANSNVKLIPRLTVIMSFKLTIGKRAITKTQCYTNEAICAFIPKHKNEIDTNFFYHHLGIIDLVQDVDQAVKGKTINKSKIMKIRTKLPNLLEQIAIAQRIEAFDLQQEDYLKTRIFLVKEKQALMQQLLTGKRRVKVDDDRSPAQVG